VCSANFGNFIFGKFPFWEWDSAGIWAETLRTAARPAPKVGKLFIESARVLSVKVVSVNVGLPREVEWKGMTVVTGIFKEPVAGSVAVRKHNLDGDRQADLTVHGGPDKAVYGYASEHYPYWRSQFPQMELPWGTFGENLTTEGVSENSLHIGDTLRAGSAVLMVAQPRMPCYKMQIRFRRDDIIQRFLMSGRSGFYFSIVEEGEVAAGSPIEVLSRDENKVTIADIYRIYVGQEPDPELLRRVLKVPALPEGLRRSLLKRVRR
jgi:MOSC domain-containing protein YiiM